MNGTNENRDIWYWIGLILFLPVVLSMKLAETFNIDCAFAMLVGLASYAALGYIGLEVVS